MEIFRILVELFFKLATEINSVVYIVKSPIPLG